MLRLLRLLKIVVARPNKWSNQSNQLGEGGPCFDVSMITDGLIGLMNCPTVVLLYGSDFPVHFQSPSCWGGTWTRCMIWKCMDTWGLDRNSCWILGASVMVSVLICMISIMVRKTCSVHCTRVVAGSPRKRAGQPSCHGTTSLLSFLVFVCSLPHLHHLLPPSDLVCLPSATSTPTLRCTHATMLCPCSD